MSVDLTGLSSYTDYMTDTSRVAAEELQSKLQNTADAEDVEDDALLDACKQFEAYLWEQVYKEMEKTAKVFSDDDEEDGYASNMVDYFKDSAIQEISEQTTSQGANSLAQTLYEQAKRNYNL
jgi:Rod binding domain-containing protein